MKISALFLFLLLLSSPLYAADSLAVYYNQVEEALNRKDYKTVYRISELGMQQAIRLHNDTLHIYFLGNFGFCYDAWGNPQTALGHYEEALRIARRYNIRMSMADLMLNIGIIMKRQGDYVQALNYLQQATSILEEGYNQETNADMRRDWQERLVSGFNTMAYIRKELLDTATCIGAMTQALNIQKQMHNTEDVARTYNMLGEYSFQIGRFGQALAYLKQSLELKQQLGNTPLMASTYMNLGNVYDSLHQQNQAITYYQHAWDIQQDAGDEQGLSQSCARLAGFMLTNARYDSAFAFINMGLPLAIKHRLSYDLCQYYNVRRKLYLQMGNLHESLEDAENYIRLQELLTSESRIRQISYLILRYERELRVAQAAVAQKQANEKKFLIAGIVLLLLLFVTLLQVYLQIRKRKNQVEFLLRELNHRVKNNLQMLYSVMGLQRQSLQSADAGLVLEENRQRIWAMMLVHRKLYASKNSTDVNVAEYLEKLVKEAVLSSDYAKTLRLNTELITAIIPTDQAIILGLIINELMSNAFKYAFPGNPEPVMEVSLEQEVRNQLKLRFADNGRTTAHSNTEHAATFGHKLIDTLCRQLNATPNFETSNGTVFTLLFKTK